jgi:L-threonylcarbamoyladenylate synthase
LDKRGLKALFKIGMLILSPTTKNIQKARQIIKNGGLIIYPTDTLYGLGADIFNQKAVEKIFTIKGRDFKKPISIMVSKIEEIRKLAFLNQEQEKIVKGLLPGPFTIILKKKKNIPKILTAGSSKVGIRIPDSKICQKLSKNLPITTTSANLSGQKPTLNIKKLAKIFDKQIDLILKGKDLSGKPSTIIDLTKKPFKIIRN